MAGTDRQVHGMGSGASAARNRRRTGGPAVRLDRCGDAAAAGHVAGRRRQDARARLRDEECQGGALVINSPGGSPVQSRQIYLRIRQLAAEKKLPVLVFVEDGAASGGYMFALR